MTQAFFITTYNVANLRLSLPAIARFIRQNPFHEYSLLISNDNPVWTVTESFIGNIIDLKLFKQIVLLNTDKNLGCLGNRMKCIKEGYERLEGIKYFMFIDDDDIILNPSFDSDAFEIEHHAVVTHRLLEQLQMIDNPNPDLNSKFVEFEEWKAGCVGYPIQLGKYYEFIRSLEGYLPELYKLYGSTRVMEPDDVILWNLWRVWIDHVYGDCWAEDKTQCKHGYSYSLTLIEDRKGRYPVEEGICDLRYGEYDGETSYQGIVDPMIQGYYNYLNHIK